MDKRQKIKEIYSNTTLTPLEKSKLVFKILNPDYKVEDYQSNSEEKCDHYDRYCKSYCKECDLFWNCFRCHDENINTHKFNYCKIKSIKCNICNTDQKISNKCINCYVTFGKYYCNICSLWQNKNIDIYHCDKCGVCRIGREQKTYHCDMCNICLVSEDKHTCIKDTFKSNCPICGEYLHDSNKDSSIMKCGHCIHNDCFLEYAKTNYKCPLCK